MNDSERYVCVADIKKKLHSVMNTHFTSSGLRKDILGCFKKVSIHSKGELRTTLEEKHNENTVPTLEQIIKLKHRCSKTRNCKKCEFFVPEAAHCGFVTGPMDWDFKNGESE